MKLIDRIKDLGWKTRNKWRECTTGGKIKMVLKGMSYVGCGWAAGKLSAEISEGEPKLAKACMFVASIGLGTGAGFVSGEMLDNMVDAFVDEYNKEVKHDGRD